MRTHTYQNEINTLMSVFVDVKMYMPYWITTYQHMTCVINFAPIKTSETLSWDTYRSL